MTMVGVYKVCCKVFCVWCMYCVWYVYECMVCMVCMACMMLCERVQSAGQSVAGFL